MFSVYDGHGADGHEAASFAKKKLPQVLAKYLRQKRVKKYMDKIKADGQTTKGAWNPKKWPFLETLAFEECCQKSFLEANEAMHSEKSVSAKHANPRLPQFHSIRALIGSMVLKVRR